MNTFRSAMALALMGIAATATPESKVARIPEFTHHAPADWINSPPLRLADLRGKVVLIEFWTFDCINCRNTLPWLQATSQRFADDGLVIVSVHTPELPQERNPGNVRAAVARLGIRYPVMVDTDFSYWNAMGNQYWPAFYLVDRQGQLVEHAAGELHAGELRGDQFTARVEQELARR